MEPSPKKKTNAQQGIAPEKAEQIENMLNEAEKVKGETLAFTPTGDIETQNVIAKILQEASAIDDPAAKYDVYYKGIEKTLRKHLPKGKSNARARGLIREEKCVYMTRGKRKDEKGLRHGDSRQTYLDDGHAMYAIVLNWASSGANMVDLYNTLVKANIDKGYGKRTIY